MVGAIILGISFAINPAPPAGATTVQLADFASQHYGSIVLGAWMQATGSLLVVLFALALVHFAGASQRYAGWITLLSGSVILMVSLVEVALYLSAVQAAVDGDVTTGLTSAAVIKQVQHLFLIAPALLLPLAFVLLKSGVLPRVFAYTALPIGALLQIGGLLGLLVTIQPIVDGVLIVQNAWFIIAGIVLVLRKPDSSTWTETAITRKAKKRHPWQTNHRYLSPKSRLHRHNRMPSSECRSLRLSTGFESENERRSINPSASSEMA
jgi:hypothetical protein